MAYTTQIIVNYNDDPPADDGSAVVTNQVKFSKVKDELADPIRVLAEAINAELLTAFSQLFLGNTSDEPVTFNVGATTDDGTLFNCTAALTVNLPPAADAGDGFAVVILNNSGNNTITIDGNGSETINGNATVTLSNDLDAFILVSTGSLWHGIKIADISGDNTFTGKIIYPDDGELTISSGAVTPTGVFHTIDTEADAASDDLDTISSATDGQILIFRPDNTARTVVVKDGTGNIETGNGQDITLDSTETFVFLIFDGALSKWIVISSSAGLSGNTVQRVVSTTASVSTTTAVVPFDDTIPTNTEGTEILTATITPTSAANTLRITIRIHFEVNLGQVNAITSLFKDSDVPAIATQAENTADNNRISTVELTHDISAGSTSSQTFKARVGVHTASTLTINGSGGSRIFGGVLISSMEIAEIQV